MITLFLNNTLARFFVFSPRGLFAENYKPETSGWNHLVMNYFGSENGQGIRVYVNGTERGRRTEILSNDILQAGTGRVVVGKYSASVDEGYAGVEVDELLFFNQTLDDDQITEIKNIP